MVMMLTAGLGVSEMMIGRDWSPVKVLWSTEVGRAGDTGLEEHTGYTGGVILGELYWDGGGHTGRGRGSYWEEEGVILGGVILGRGVILGGVKSNFTKMLPGFFVSMATL